MPEQTPTPPSWGKPYGQKVEPPLEGYIGTLRRPDLPVPTQQPLEAYCKPVEYSPTLECVQCKVAIFDPTLGQAEHETLLPICYDIAGFEGQILGTCPRCGCDTFKDYNTPDKYTFSKGFGMGMLFLVALGSLAYILWVFTRSIILGE